MITTKVIAGGRILRGQFVIPGPDDGFVLDPTMKGTGGIARRPYGTWPPEPIEPGEEFEIMVSGGAQGLIGDKQFWLEIRDGRFRMDLHKEADAANLRQALFMTGHGW